MITFKQFVGEDQSVGELADLIDKESPGFVKRLGGNGLLYRGISRKGEFIGRFKAGNETVPVYKVKVRKDREPLNTHPAVHKAVDDWFEENLGIRARSQSAFTFGDGGRLRAAGYGNELALVFPVGKFHYAWSPEVGDLYENLEADLQHRGKPHPDFLDAKGKMDPEKVDAYMKKLKYTMNGIDEAVNTNREIMVAADEMLVIPFESFADVRKVKQALGVTMPENVKKP